MAPFRAFMGIYCRKIKNFYYEPPRLVVDAVFQSPSVLRINNWASDHWR